MTTSLPTLPLHLFEEWLVRDTDNPTSSLQSDFKQLSTQIDTQYHNVVNPLLNALERILEGCLHQYVLLLRVPGCLATSLEYLEQAIEIQRSVQHINPLLIQQKLERHLQRYNVEVERANLAREYLTQRL